MIKEFKNPDKLKIHVLMKDGIDFIGCDIPEKPFEQEGLTAFFEGECLSIIPLDLIKKIELYEES